MNEDRRFILSTMDGILVVSEQELMILDAWRVSLMASNCFSSHLEITPFPDNNICCRTSASASIDP